MSSHSKMNVVRILFLGASKRVSLLERFIATGQALGIGLDMYSCELDSGFCPISHLATVLQGPSFCSEEFQSWLDDCISQHQINLIIPNMDSATVALSKFDDSCCRAGIWPVVSSHPICAAMYDKVTAHQFFRENGIPVPLDTADSFPKIVKPRFGFGSRGVRRADSAAELRALFDHQNRQEFLVQDLILDGRETTVDFYSSRTKGMLGYVLRDRLEVSDGEVMVCKTREPMADERALLSVITSLAEWVGCVTVQYMRDGRDGKLYVIEVNPRFGGGATCAIEAGLDMPRYILCEFLGLDFARPQRLRMLIMSRARRDFFYELE